ncbi:hypothetical protein H4582DRAFT_1941203 [Lactarius indigo]|nr:hypothetical protein H4582DRAFT_1941203 [Lactarius indigo]
MCERLHRSDMEFHNNIKPKLSPAAPYSRTELAQRPSKLIDTNAVLDKMKLFLREESPPLPPSLTTPVALFPPTPIRFEAALMQLRVALKQMANSSPELVAECKTTLNQFLSHPDVATFLPHSSSNPPPPSDAILKELKELKGAIAKLGPQARQATDTSRPTRNSNPKTIPPTPKPQPQPPLPTPLLRPTLIAHTRINASDPHPPISGLINKLNSLFQEGTPAHMRFSSARWSGTGNLVLTGGPGTTAQQLLKLDTQIQSIISDFLSSPLPLLTVNSKWSKILINNVPTGVTTNSGPASPHDCHLSLLTHNPVYATLMVTQKPSWVRPPSSLTPHSHSSLVMAFEDPTGAVLQQLIKNKSLHIFGTEAPVKAWKDKKRPRKNTTTQEHKPESHATPDHQSPRLSPDVTEQLRLMKEALDDDSDDEISLILTPPAANTRSKAVPPVAARLGAPKRPNTADNKRTAKPPARVGKS